MRKNSIADSKQNVQCYILTDSKLKRKNPRYIWILGRADLDSAYAVFHCRRERRDIRIHLKKIALNKLCSLGYLFGSLGRS